MLPIPKAVCLVWLAPPLCSQSLQIQADSVARGQEGAAVIRLDSPAGKEPVALQWEIHLPVSIQLDLRKVVAADAASAAAKSVTCAIQVNRTGDTTRCRCILAGGAKPIGNGPIATLKYTPARSVRPGRYQINLRSGFAVSEGTKKLPIKDAGITIVVSP
jgi:hypothetical protein